MGSGVAFGESVFHVVRRCPKTTPDPVPRSTGSGLAKQPAASALPLTDHGTVPNKGTGSTTGCICPYTRPLLYRARLRMAHSSIVV